jgi:hypothetical protein
VDRGRLSAVGPGERPARVGSLLPALRQIARVLPQDALQLLGRQAASQQPPHVHLRALDERRTEALVQSGAAAVIGLSDVPLWITHDDEGSGRARSVRSAPTRGYRRAARLRFFRGQADCQPSESTADPSRP